MTLLLHSSDVLALHFDVELVSPLDGGLVADLVLALCPLLSTLQFALVPVISDTSLHSNDLMRGHTKLITC